MITVIIPTVNDPYLKKTMIDVWEHSSRDIDFIVINDGGTPLPDLHIDNSITTPMQYEYQGIEHKKTLGRRVSINKAAKIAKGSHLFILDAHCSMTPEWDTKMLESCPEKGIVVSCIQDMYGDSYELRPGVYGHVYLNRAYEEKWWSRKPVKRTEEMMCFTGCSWLIPKDYFWECEGYDESLGGYGWDGPEWACKVWMGPNPGKVFLRSDVTCGHVFGTNENTKLFPISKILYGDYRQYMIERYGDKIEAFRKKFSPLPDEVEKKKVAAKPCKSCSEKTKKKRDVITTVKKVDIVESKRGEVVFKIVKVHYKPYKVAHDGSRTDKEIELLVNDYIKDVEREEVILG